MRLGGDGGGKTIRREVDCILPFFFIVLYVRVLSFGFVGTYIYIYFSVHFVAAIKCTKANDHFGGRPFGISGI